MGKLARVLLLLAVAVSVSVCGRKGGDIAGRLENNIYRNDHFGFTLGIPDGMYALDAADIEKSGLAILKEPLLAVFFDPGGGAADSIAGPNLIITCERLPAGRDVRAEQYTAMALKHVETGGMETTAEGSHRVELGGREFLRTRISHGVLYGREVRQEYYVLIDRGWALVFVSTYDSGEAGQGIGRLLGELRFDRPLP